MLFSPMYSKLLNNPEQRNPFWISADLFILTILLDNIAYLQWVEVLSLSMHYSDQTKVSEAWMGDLRS